MTPRIRGIDPVLTLAVAVSTSHGCGQVSLGTTTSDVGGMTSIGGTGGHTSGGFTGGSPGTGAIASTLSSGTGGAALGGLDGGDDQAPHCGVSAGVGRVACGDVNRDTRVDVNDALMLEQYVQGLPVTVWLDACDVNCDGQITSEDATMIGKYSAGSISSFSCAPKQP